MGRYSKISETVLSEVIPNFPNYGGPTYGGLTVISFLKN